MLRKQQRSSTSINNNITIISKMKKNFIFTAMAASALFTLASCDNDNDSSAAKYITVSTSIGDMTCVATDTDGSQAFENGDQISVFAWTGDAAVAPAAAERVVDNAINTLDNKVWKATPQMLWKDMTSNHYFIGVYPKFDAAVADLTKAAYSLDPADQEKSDMLVAVNSKGMKASENPVLLSFDHIMAQLIVNLSFRTQFGGAAKVTAVNAVGMADKATVNLLTKAVTADATQTTVSLGVTEANKSYRSIVVPQTGFKQIDVVIDGKTFTYTHATEISLASGKQTVVNLIVGRDEITLGSVNINPWGTGETLNGDALD